MVRHSSETAEHGGEIAKKSAATRETRAVRADAQRNIDTLLEAAKTVFAASGVEAPVREIATAAGVGVGTVYRHFPRRSDLIVAVFKREVDACAAAALALANEHAPLDALSRWLIRYTRFVAAKRGLSTAIHSGDPAFNPLPAYFEEHLGPALKSLLTAAAEAGEVRADVEPMEFLRAVSMLCKPMGADDVDHGQRMVLLLIDGLRYRASEHVAKPAPKRSAKNTRASSRKKTA